MSDYGKSGHPKRNSKEPRNPYDKPGPATDKAALLARMKAAAQSAQGDEDDEPTG